MPAIANTSRRVTETNRAASSADTNGSSCTGGSMEGCSIAWPPIGPEPVFVKRSASQMELVHHVRVQGASRLNWRRGAPTHPGTHVARLRGIVVIVLRRVESQTFLLVSELRSSNFMESSTRGL